VRQVVRPVRSDDAGSASDRAATRAEGASGSGLGSRQRRATVKSASASHWPLAAPALFKSERRGGTPPPLDHTGKSFTRRSSSALGCRVPAPLSRGSGHAPGRSHFSQRRGGVASRVPTPDPLQSSPRRGQWGRPVPPPLRNRLGVDS
jgi:hypothetical protein